MSEPLRPAATSEIRPLRPEDAVARAFVTGYAFAADRGTEAVEEFAADFPLEWARGLFLDGALVASLLVVPYRMQLGDLSLAVGGIADVACLPEQRRRGHVAALLRDTLADLHAHGTPLSALYTPHVPLYRRYGWEVATQSLRIRFATKQASLRAGARPRGHAERIAPDDWLRAARVHEAWLNGRYGDLHRWEQRWRRQLFSANPVRDAAIWVDEQGRDRGYAFYHDHGWQGGERGVLEVREVIGLDGDAYRGLIAYLLSHDLARETLWETDENDPLPAVLADPGVLKVERSHGLLLRLVDVPAALAARRPRAGDCSFTLRLVDESCPWNDGTWRVSAEAGRIETRTSTAVPDLMLTAGTLAALYAGSVIARLACEAGLIVAARPAALDALDSLFGGIRFGGREYF